MTRSYRILGSIACGITMAVASQGLAWAAADGRSERATRSALPANIALDEAVRELVEDAVALSQTLRRQLAVVADAPVMVEVRVSLAPLPAFRRAEATISRYESGFLRARILLPSGADFVELLAHELEHVVEQIEGVDLATLARGGQAMRDAHGVFETVRARDAGRAAAQEVEQAEAQPAVH